MKLPTPFGGMKPVKALVVGADAEARRMGDSTTGAEHLLLSALALPDGSARRAFERSEGDPDAVGAAIAEQHAQALRAIGIDPVPDELLSAGAPRGHRRLNESAAHVLRSAVTVLSTEDRYDRAPTFGARVVEAVAELEHGTAARTLRVMGIDRSRLAAAAREEIAAAKREAA